MSREEVDVRSSTFLLRYLTRPRKTLQQLLKALLQSFDPVGVWKSHEVSRGLTRPHAVRPHDLAHEVITREMSRGLMAPLRVKPLIILLMTTAAQPRPSLIPTFQPSTEPTPCDVEFTQLPPLNGWSGRAVVAIIVRLREREKTRSSVFSCGFPSLQAVMSKTIPQDTHRSVPILRVRHFTHTSRDIPKGSPTRPEDRDVASCNQVW